MTETTGTIVGKTFPANDGATNVALLAIIRTSGLSEAETDNVLVAVEKSLTGPRQRVPIYRPGKGDQTPELAATVNVTASGNLSIAVLPKQPGITYRLRIPRTAYQRDRIKRFLRTVQIPHREEGGNDN
ncbi:hypothetical protein A2810_00425 [candidate division Kazan bacterium RIFCSPHIGHO2_01_FULL_49_10]|uniref:Uncharacterized protein n=1 Tax=candidate division Kazan bacterium RIFCSPLOWO2_01_FULL_48_13 TaxID=1798539 RepID=A0A1F4PNZ0_UNCK3|nr:MAG: hypothetical protein A2810_00425 [candidate division Kazan bacterium RIFCSPHIGHO2_01_FULL_49_10]OGB85563.1 MAG: hypothetical protein A2994_00875 [candidate division Kazan bacterium RIFCSPLOWO2_01_FULL_48_13]